MSSIVNKVKDALSGDKTTTSHPEGTSGPHNTRTANAADPRVDSDRDHRAAHNLRGEGDYTSGGNYGATGGNYSALGGNQHSTLGGNQHSALGGSHSTTTGGNHSALGGSHSTTTGGNYSTTGDGPAPNTAGPHKSDLLNKADPRVDSDRDNSRNLGANSQGTSGTGGAFFNGGRNQGTTGALSSEAYAGNAPEGTHGPHSSRVANAADPRVDSDRDGSRNLGTQGTHTTGGLAGTGTHHQTGAHHTTGTHQTTGNQFGTTGTHHTTGNQFGTTGTHTTSSGLCEGSTGPHNSRIANAADPRVDSDRDNSHNLGRTGGTSGGLGTTGNQFGTIGTQTGTHGTSGTHHTTGNQFGTTGGHHTTGTHTGAHSGSGAYGSTAGGVSSTGPAPKTAGPHKSDMMNKLDPRVDSDLDGSKTVGRDQTFSQSSGTGSRVHKDPTDAAQVPPSVLQKHIGAPTVEHGDEAHDRARRHSVSHQEQHRGL